MTKPFDASLNSLIDIDAGEWAAYLAAQIGIPPGPAELVDTDLSVTAQADKVFRINGPVPGLIHLELQASSRLEIPNDILRYNVLLGHIHKLPVHSVLVLLRPKANATDLTERLELKGCDGEINIVFRYAVIRIWEKSVQELLNAGPSLAPLALLTDEAYRNLPAAFDQLREEFRQKEVSKPLQGSLLSSSYFLLGLRYNDEQVREIYERLSMILEESTTYQHVLKLGEARGVALGEARGARIGSAREGQNILLRLGRKKFGENPNAEPTIRAIDDVERLETLAERVLDVSNWDDLLKS